MVSFSYLQQVLSQIVKTIESNPEELEVSTENVWMLSFLDWSKIFKQEDKERKSGLCNRST